MPDQLEVKPAKGLGAERGAGVIGEDCARILRRGFCSAAVFIGEEYFWDLWG